MYKRAPRLFQEIAVARVDGTYPKLMNKLAKMKVLIIDDFCITPMKDAVCFKNPPSHRTHFIVIIPF